MKTLKTRPQFPQIVGHFLPDVVMMEHVQLWDDMLKRHSLDYGLRFGEVSNNSVVTPGMNLST